MSKASRTTLASFPENKQLPFVSVIIPVYNDPAGLYRTLSSIATQDYPTDLWETIVVDNNSQDNSKSIAESFEKIISQIKVEKEAKQGAYAARNRGVVISRGKILAFIDADMTVEPDWISTGVKDMEENNADYVGCRVDILPARSTPRFFEMYNQKMGFPIKQYMEKHGFAGAGNLFVKKTVLEKVGNFDNRLQSSGDLEFGNRVRDAKFNMYYSDHNVMQHPARSSFKSLLIKSIRITNGHIDLKWYYPERYGQLDFYEILQWFFPKTVLLKLFKKAPTIKKIHIFLFSIIIQGIGTINGLWRYFQIKSGKIRKNLTEVSSYHDQS